MESLASPEGSEWAGGNEVAKKPLPPSAKNEKQRGYNRRDTADFSTINSLLDESMASSVTMDADTDSNQLRNAASAPSTMARSDGPAYLHPDARSRGLLGESDAPDFAATPPAVAAKGRRGDETADFSSLMTLVENDATETETPPRDDGPKPPARPRARRHSNQKPGRDGKGAWFAAPPSVPLGGSATIGEGSSASVGGGGVGDVRGASGKVSRPVSARPKSPARRPRRSITLDPSRKPASWEDNAAPTITPPEAVRY